METKNLFKYIVTLLICCAFILSGTVAAQTKSKKDAEKKTTKTVEKKATTKAKKATTAKSGATKPININKAKLEELTTLDGIGEERAKKIIEYRKKNGPFKKPEDLMNINGIGPKIFEKNKALIKIK